MEQRGDSGRAPMTSTHSHSGITSNERQHQGSSSSCKRDKQCKQSVVAEPIYSVDNLDAPDDSRYLRKESKASVSQIRLQETFINVNSLENNDEGHQSSEAWKRKRRRTAPPGFESSVFMKSEPVVRVHHVLEENILLSLASNFFRAFVMLFVCIPVSVLVLTFLPFAFLFKYLSEVNFAFHHWHCNRFRSNSVQAQDEQFILANQEAVMQSILFLDGPIDLKKIRYIISSRAIQAKTGSGKLMYPRLTETVVFLPSGPVWCHDGQFRLQNHIISGPEITSESSLQKYAAHLLSQPLQSSRPLWEIIVIHNFGKGRDTVLICRLHQCLADGISLLKVLCQSISDNQIAHIPHKPHFGGATYGMNWLRTFFSGPLTVFSWLFAWRPDLNFFTFRRLPSFYRIPSLTSSIANGTKGCCGRKCQSEITENSINGGSKSELHTAYTLSNSGDSSNFILSWGASISMNRIIRIKQITRTCLNEVLLAALSGALRITLKKLGVQHPSDMRTHILVDLRNNSSPFSAPKMGNKVSSIPVTLPTSIEGAVPRIWRVRHIMDEVKSSADSVVSYGLVWFALRCLPGSWAKKCLRRLYSLASLQYSSLPGPQASLLIGGYVIKRIFNISPPRNPMGVSVTVFTYADRVHITVTAKKTLLQSRFLVKEILHEIENQCDQISETLCHRRLPGEQKRAFIFTSSQIHSSIPIQDLQMTLAKVQSELQAVTQQYDLEVRRGLYIVKPGEKRNYSDGPKCRRNSVEEAMLPSTSFADANYRRFETPPKTRSRESSRRRQLSVRVQELKEEFTELLTEIRRRKSIQEGGLPTGSSPQVEEDDGEVRKPRMRALSVASVRSVASLASVASREFSLPKDGFPQTPKSASSLPDRQTQSEIVTDIP